MIIDVHNHFYPEKYIQAIEKGPSFYKITRDKDGNPVIHSPGDYNVAVPGHRLLDVKLKVMDEQGIDTQVFSFTCPGTVVETPERARELSRMINDTFHEMASQNSDRLVPLATLPLNDPAGSEDELERAMKVLKFPGAMIYSNVNKVGLNDKRFEPLWKKANALKAVIHIHPTYPAGVEAMEQFMLMPLVGFCMDTTLAAAGLVFAGVPHRYPNIKWVLGHLGGTIPYLAERLDRGYEAFPECRENIDQLPSKYLKKFFYDTVNFARGALELAINFAGAGQILAGSDYPHMIGSIPKMKESINSLSISKSDKEKILGRNAEEVYNIN